MAKKKTPWLKHKKYGAKRYFGFYQRHDGEREFHLVRSVFGTNLKPHKVVYESHEAAKRDGWIKQK